MAVLHQSDLGAWARCPAAFNFERQGQPRRTTSALAYGSVMHHAMEVFERERHAGRSHGDAVQAAMDTFQHYWNPMNIESICAPVDLWLPRQSYNSLLKRGLWAIQTYADMLKFDEYELLATEFGFQVPIAGTWDPDTESEHILAGTIDRLAVRWFANTETLNVQDWKTGKEYRYLRQNLQFTAYTYATTRHEFWAGWNGEDGFGPDRGERLYKRFQGAPRRGTWLNLQKATEVDAGWRGPEDYRRFAIACDQVAASMRADIYPLTLSGETCQFCEFRDICTGNGVPADDHGAPAPITRKASR